MRQKARYASNVGPEAQRKAGRSGPKFDGPHEASCWSERLRQRNARLCERAVIPPGARGSGAASLCSFSLVVL